MQDNLFVLTLDYTSPTGLNPLKISTDKSGEGELCGVFLPFPFVDIVEDLTQYFNMYIAKNPVTSDHSDSL